MPKQKVSEAYIIQQSLQLFRRKSYHTTSIADIAESCGLLKGSIYHYFSSKEALMKAVINNVHEYFTANVFSIAYDETLSPFQRMEKMFKKSKSILLSDDGGDVMGNIGVETARVIPEFAEQIRHFFAEWMQAKEHIYVLIVPAEKAKIYAEQTVAEIEGAVMMTRIFRDPKFINNAYNRVIEQFSILEVNNL